jgi:predicted DsbA family dithiol-disulfide isomerase
MTRVSPREDMEFELFYDYRCPYVYRASVLIENVKASGKREFDVRWRYFSLTQVNSKQEGWTVWGAPETEEVRGRLSFKAAEAARRQHKFDEFHMPLLHARHRDNLDIEDVAVVERVAVESGLDLARFRQDVADAQIINALARDHQHAVSEHGVFGTPTFVFAGGASAYVRLSAVLEGDEALHVFDDVIAIASSEPRILEIKRPTKPSGD